MRGERTDRADRVVAKLEIVVGRVVVGLTGTHPFGIERGGLARDGGHRLELPGPHGAAARVASDQPGAHQLRRHAVPGGSRQYIDVLVELGHVLGQSTEDEVGTVRCLGRCRRERVSRIAISGRSMPRMPGCETPSLSRSVRGRPVTVSRSAGPDAYVPRRCPVRSRQLKKGCPPGCCPASTSASPRCLPRRPAPRGCRCP